MRSKRISSAIKDLSPKSVNILGSTSFDNPRENIDPHVKTKVVSTREAVIGGYSMPTTDGTVGQVLTTDGSGNVSWGAATPQTGMLEGVLVYKPTDETVNNSTTMQDDDDIVLPVLANQVWVFDANIMYTSAANAHLDIGFSVPAGTTMQWSWLHFQWVVLSEASEITISGNTTKRAFPLHGYIKTGATPGDIHFRWAQGIAQASDTTVHEGTYFHFKRVV